MDFDSLQADTQAAPQPTQQTQSQTEMPSSTPVSFDSLQDDSAQYSTPGGTAAAAAEAASRGVAGPVATYLEKNLLGVPKEDILARERAHPAISAAGEAAGFVVSALTGAGEAAVLNKIGEAVVGTGAAVKGASYLHRVGSEAVKQAVEMAVMQGGDEVHKMILNDPDSSAQTAIANAGLAAVLGGAGGAAFAGAINPLWKATAAEPLDKILNTVRDRWNGKSALMSDEAVQSAIDSLGVTPEPYARAAVSNNPTAKDYISTLKRSENQKVSSSLDKLHKDVTDSVISSLRIPLEDIAHYSEKDAGVAARDAWSKEFKAKYEPIAEQLEKRNELASTINLTDDTKLDSYNNLLEKGITKVPRANSPAYRAYTEWGDELLNANSIGDIDRLKTDLNGELDKHFRAGDTNMINALKDIREHLADLQESQIEKQSTMLEKQGAERGAAIGRDIIAERQATNQKYRDFRQTMDQFADHLGIRKPSGYKGLVNQVFDKITPESFLEKASPRGNAEVIPFLQQHFPDFLEHVKDNETKRFMKSAVSIENGEATLNIKKLGKAIENAQKGKTELVNLALSPETISKVQSANTLLDAVPSPKNSGTPAGIMKIFGKIPSSAIAVIGWLTGHGPMASILLGETAAKVGLGGPEAYKLAYLNFLASEKPVEAGAFKASVDYMHNVLRGDAALNRGVTSVFKGGATQIPSFAVPDAAKLAKLDRLVAQQQEDPNNQQQTSGTIPLGHYMEAHQTSVSQSSLGAAQYLAGLKPKPYQSSPLDKEIPPSKTQEIRYQRALTIAQQPMTVLQHVKDGTLQPSDIQDINSMYPDLYKGMVTKMSNMMNTMQASGESIPYHTRLSLSLFMGQAMDSTMQPSSIQAAQPKAQGPVPAANAKAPKSSKSTSSLSKTSASYMTPGQNAEKDRSSRD